MMKLKWQNIILLFESTLVIPGDSEHLLKISQEGELREFLNIAIRKGKPCLDGSISLNGLSISNELIRQLEDLSLLSNEGCDEVEKKHVAFGDITLEVTPFCPLECKHCLLPNPYKKKRSMLPLDKALSIIEESSEVLVPYPLVSLTGGEPSLLPRSYIKSITDSVREHGGEVMINTNCLNYKSITKLGDHVFIKVTLYGCDEKSYMNFTGFNVFKNIIKCLEELKRNNDKFGVSIRYTKIHEEMGYKVEDMLNFAYNFTENVRVDTAIHKGWFGEKDVVALTPSYIYKNPSGDKLSTLLRLHREYIIAMSPSDTCGATRLPGPFITHDGYVLTCPFFNEIVAHIDNTKWMELYYIKMIKRRILPWDGGVCGVYDFIR